MPPKSLKKIVAAPEEKIVSLLPAKKEKRRWTTAVWIAAAVFVFIGLVFGAARLYAAVYAERVYPGVYLASFHLGGMSGDEVKKFLENFDNRLSGEGLAYVFSQGGEEKKVTVNPVVISSDSAVDLIYLDKEKFGQSAIAAGRGGDWFKNLWQPIYLRFHPINVDLPVSLDRVGFIQILKDALSSFENPARDAGVIFTSVAPPAYRFVAEQSGETFDYEKITAETEGELRQLSLGPLTVAKEKAEPSVFMADLAAIEKKLPAVVEAGPVFLTYGAGSEAQVWKIESDDFAPWLAPRRTSSGSLFWGLEAEKANDYLDVLRGDVDRVAEEPKFAMEQGKVREFESGQNGQALDAEKTIENLNAIFLARSEGQAATDTAVLAVAVTEPKVKLADLNNLGVSGIFGAGISTFHDSHTNRIKNIAHAVERLNGTLIAPGEDFSAIKYAGPFTAENGYLPEEVIKGAKILKEIGGGMCQIGTTLFRMAMNSGMPITERTNHSLVVGYYADPVNGNPGTDATVYEPILDFKFLNDTGNYLLLQTDIDFKKQRLTFTLWGKPDGRSGSYTHPLVSRWIPAGEPKEIKTLELKPGEQKCQNAFRGAVASFTYTRFTSAGEKIERVFTSTYRPLPKTCMVGVDPAVCPDPNNCDLGGASTSTPTGNVPPEA